MEISTAQAPPLLGVPSRTSKIWLITGIVTTCIGLALIIPAIVIFAHETRVVEHSPCTSPMMTLPSGERIEDVRCPRHAPKGWVNPSSCRPFYTDDCCGGSAMKQRGGCTPLEMLQSTCDGRSADYAAIVIRNDSYMTSCAEVDNVQLKFFKDSHDAAKKAPTEVVLAARAPRYQLMTNMNNRSADWSDCPCGSGFVQPVERRAACDGKAEDVDLGRGWRVDVLCESGFAFGSGLFSSGTLTDKPFTMLQFRRRGSVFVYYSNGFSRSMYVPPAWLPAVPGMYSPMGTSVVIGPIKPSSTTNRHALPWVPVSTVKVISASPLVKLEVTIDQSLLPGAQRDPYQLIISDPTVKELRVTVSGLSWSSTAIPYMMVSSMFVRKGKSDGETLTTSDMETRAVIVHDSGDPQWFKFPGVNNDKWTYLKSNSYALTKQCVSGHNTRAPDMYVAFGCDEPPRHAPAQGVFRV